VSNRNLKIALLGALLVAVSVGFMLTSPALRVTTNDGVTAQVTATPRGFEAPHGSEAPRVSETPRGTEAPRGTEVPPVFVGAFDGSISRVSVQATDVFTTACSGRPVMLLAPSKARLLAACRGAQAEAQAFLIDVVTKATNVLAIPIIPRQDAAAWSPDGSRLAFLASCDGCGTRVMTWSAGTTQEIQAGGNVLASLKWTPFGLTVYQEQPSDTRRAGTYRLDGTGWTWVSSDALFDATDTAQLFQRVDRTGERARFTVLLRHSAGESVLTPAGIDELPIGIMPDGSVLTWRAVGAADRVLVRYRNGASTVVAPGYRTGLFSYGDRFVAVADGTTVRRIAAESGNAEAAVTISAPITVIAVMPR